MNNNQERAVSPVIGVALMIGIVVVLAGAIGFAVLDFGSDVGAEPQASVDVEQIDSTDDAAYRVTWVSGGNSDYLTFNGADGGINTGAYDAGTDQVTSNTAEVYGASDLSGTSSYDASSGLASPGESAVVVFQAEDTTGQVSVIAAIDENPDDSTAVIEDVSN